MTVVRDRKIRTVLRTNQIVGFVTVPAWKKNKLHYRNLSITIQFTDYNLPPLDRHLLKGINCATDPTYYVYHIVVHHISLSRLLVTRTTYCFHESCATLIFQYFIMVNTKKTSKWRKGESF